MVHDPATLASPDLLSDVSEMKQDLIKISGFLTKEVSEPSLADGLIYCVEDEEPFEMVEKVKEDLEKVEKILSVGNFGEETDKSKCNKDAAEEKSQVTEPILREVRITRATDCSSAPQKDASEIISHLSTDLECYLQHLPVTAHPVQEESITEEIFTEVVLPRKRHPPRIKKPARKKLKEREFVSCSSEDELERMSSEESLDGETLLGDSELEVPPVSPKVVETPIGSIKDRVKALQKKVKEEEMEESVKVREVRRVTAVQCKTFLTKEEKYTLPPKSPKSPRSQSERIEHSMSVKELMKAFQTGQDPSKSKSGLFEHKVITNLVLTSEDVTEDTKKAQISDLQTSGIKPSAEEIDYQSIMLESSQIIHDQSQQNKTVISNEIIQKQVQRTLEDTKESNTDSIIPSRLNSENTLINASKELHVAPAEDRNQYGESGETSNMSSGYEEEGKEEILTSEDKIIQTKQSSKDQEKIKAKDSTITVEVWHLEEEHCGPEILHYKKLSTSHNRRTSEEPQISPDRKPSEDFSAVIKEELEESPEYQLFIQAAGPSTVTSYSEKRTIEDSDQVEHTVEEQHSYKPKPAVRFASTIVQSEKFIPTVIHNVEINEKPKVQAGGEFTDTVFWSRTPRKSLGEYEAYEEDKETENLIVSDQKIKSPTEPEGQPEEKSAMQFASPESGSPKSAEKISIEETQVTDEKEGGGRDTIQMTFCMEIKNPAHTEPGFIQKSPSDIKSQVKKEQEISFQIKSQNISSEGVSFDESEELSSRPHGLEDPQTTIIDLKVNSPDMTPDKQDISSKNSFDSVQLLSTEMKTFQTELEETLAHETEKVQHVNITTMEKTTVAETQTQSHAGEEIGCTFESVFSVQNVDDTYKASVPEETKHTKEIHEISTDKFQEIQQMPHSMLSISPDTLNDLQHITSDPEIVCKLDSQERISGNEDFFTEKFLDSVQVPSNKTPVQTERTGLPETKEDEQQVYNTTAEQFSPIEIQTEQEICINVGLDNPVQDLEDTYKVYSLKETRQTRDIIEVTSEETAESEEFQEIQRKVYSINLCDLPPEMMGGPKSAYQADPQESMPVKELDSLQNSSKEIKSPVQTVLEETYLQETEVEDHHGFMTVLEKLAPSKSPDHIAHGLHDSYKVSPDEEAKQMSGTYEVYSVETDKYERFQEIQQTVSRPDNLIDLMPIMSDPKSVCQGDSLEEEDLSSHKSPDSIEPSPTKDIPCPDSLESSPTDQRPDAKSPELLYQTSNDSQNIQDAESLTENLKLEINDEMTIQREAVISNEDNASINCELPDTEPSVPFQQSLEENYEVQEISEVKKQFTSEEKMFKMAAKIRVFDEIEKETKMRKVRFDFTTSSQDRGDELKEKDEDNQSCDSPLYDEEEDTKQKCGPESSIVLSSYQQSEQHNDSPQIDVPEDEPVQTLSEISECTYSHEYRASVTGEMEMEVLPMQIHIEKKELSHEDFSPECLIIEDKADIMVALAEDSGAVLMDSRPDSISDIECHIINEKTVEMNHSSIDIVCSVNDGKAMEEYPFQGEIVPWSAELVDKESFNLQIEVDEQKIPLQSADSQSQESTPEIPPARNPTENGQPNPFLFQEGKLFEMTRGGAIDMSRRSMEEEQDAFAFFPISEDSSEYSLSEQVRECETSLEVSIDSKREDLPQGISGVLDAPRDLESHSDSDRPKEKVLGFDSSIADIDTATSTVTRSIYSEQDMDSSDSSAEDDQHSVIEIPTPSQEGLMHPFVETLNKSSQSALSSPKKEPESRKPKSKIPVKATSFDSILGKGDSIEQNRRPKSEADIGVSDFISGVPSSSVKPISLASKIPEFVEQTTLSALPPGQPQHSHEGSCEKGSPRTVLDGYRRSAQFQTPSLGDDIFESRPNWEDCVETQMQRLSESSSPDQSKGTYVVYGPSSQPLKMNP